MSAIDDRRVYLAPASSGSWYSSNPGRFHTSESCAERGTPWREGAVTREWFLERAVKEGYRPCGICAADLEHDFEPADYPPGSLEANPDVDAAPFATDGGIEEEWAGGHSASPDTVYVDGMPKRIFGNVLIDGPDGQCTKWHPGIDVRCPKDAVAHTFTSGGKRVEMCAEHCSSDVPEPKETEQAELVPDGGTVEDDASQLVTIKRLTNKRQATKICDVKRDATLVLEKPGNRTEYVTGTDEGLYAVGIGSGGGLYMARVLTPPQVTSLARGAEVDVAQSRRGLPRAITDPKGASA